MASVVMCYEEFCTWSLVSILFDDLSGHSFPSHFYEFLLHRVQVKKIEYSWGNNGKFHWK